MTWWRCRLHQSSTPRTRSTVCIDSSRDSASGSPNTSAPGISPCAGAVLRRGMRSRSAPRISGPFASVTTCCTDASRPGSLAPDPLHDHLREFLRVVVSGDLRRGHVGEDVVHRLERCMGYGEAD